MDRANKVILALIFTFIFCNRVYPFLREKVVKGSDIIENIEFGKINWTTGKMDISATAKLPKIIKDIEEVPNDNIVYSRNKAEARIYAFSRAKKNCKKNLFNALYNLRVQNNFFIKDYLISTNSLKYKISKFINSIKNYKRIYNKDDTVTVKTIVNLWGDNSFLMAIGKIGCIDKRITKYTNTSKITQTFTSLVIDARDIKGFYPSLNPCLYDEAGKLIYSGCMIEKKEYENSGGAKFLGDTDKLPAIKYIDANSLTVRAVGRKGITGLVLSNETVNLLFLSKKTLEYLRKGRVIILLR